MPKFRLLGVAAFVLAAIALGAAVIWLRLMKPMPESGNSAPRLPPRPDILLITIDTLRADAPGFSGNKRAETPTLDRLASLGLVFEEAHAHNVVTLPSHANILTGLLPYQHGVRDNSGFRLDAGIPTIATLLKANGYRTAAFIGAFPLDSRFGLSAGFDVYDDRYPRARSSTDFEMPERPATEVVAAARAWWDASQPSQTTPRFLWVHLYDCHAPYRPPPPFDQRYRDDPYLGEVAGVDAALSPLLDPFLSGNAPPALIVVTADHGEALGDHGEKTHGLFAYEATLHIPLVVWSAPALSPGVRRDFVRHVDIAPTILQVAGIEKPADWTGSSLLAPRAAGGPPGSYFEAFSATFDRGWAPLRGMLAEGYKFIDLPSPELYDLKNDPGEKRNLVSERRDVVRRLSAQVPPESAIGAAHRENPGAEEIRQLRSLGYLSGAAVLKKTYGRADDPKNRIGVDRELNDCIDAYQSGRLAEAIGIARKIVAEAPGMSVGYENLGFLLRLSESPADAIPVYRRAVETGIATEGLRVQFARTLCQQGRATEALAVLSPLSDSRDPDTVNALGIAYSGAGQNGQAVRAFEQALSLDPRNAEADENLGVVHLHEKDPAGAREMFRRALAVDERLPEAWNGLGVALARLQDEPGAMKAWRRASELDPRLYDALYNLGVTAARSGDRAEEERALRQFIASAPSPAYAGQIENARRLLASVKLEGGGS